MKKIFFVLAILLILVGVFLYANRAPSIYNPSKSQSSEISIGKVPTSYTDDSFISVIGECLAGTLGDNSEKKMSNYYLKNSKYGYVYVPMTSSLFDLESFKYLGLFQIPYTEVGEVYAGYMGYAQDKNGAYVGCGTKIVGADLVTFKVLGYGYSKDANHVYYLDKVKEGLDPKTYKPSPLEYY